MTRSVSVMTLLLVLIFVIGTSRAVGQTAKLEHVNLDAKSSLRGLHALDKNTAWVSGSGGLVGVTTDAGANWSITYPDTTTEFRDIQAFNSTTAVVMGSGTPGKIFRTIDAGKSWQQSFRDDDPRVFLDAIAFWNEEEGVAFGDEMDGQFLMLATNDGGKSWMRLKTAPKASKGEGGFAASGTNMIIDDSGNILIGTTTGRLLKSTDKGASWTETMTPMESSGSSSGIFSMASKGAFNLLVGGDYQDPQVSDGNYVLQVSDDWNFTTNPPDGYRSGVAFVPNSTVAICTGPDATDISFDNGLNWTGLFEDGFHAISFGLDKNSGWLSGSDGRVARIIWAGN